MSDNESIGDDKKNSEITWRLEGPFDSSYSLALLNREIARALKKHGVEVALFSTEGPGDFAPSQAYLDINPDLAKMNELAECVDHSQASVTSRNLYPPRVEDMCCRINLMHSYAWEETAFPAAWVSAFNRHLSGLSSLSRHIQKIMRDNGVSVPMMVSGCGVDHWERVVAASTSVLDSLPIRGFRFLHVSSFFPRKGPVALLKAWANAFTVNDDVCLIIKTFPNPHNEVHEQIAALKERHPASAPILLIEDDLSDADLKALYQRCHVLVSPSCAEGFCLPIAEAMLSGIPAITTNWSGQLDFCNTGNSWLVDYSFEQADTHFELRPSAWAAVKVDALAAAMRSAFASDAETRSVMAQRGREQLLSKFRWSDVAERLIRFYRGIEGYTTLSDLSVGWISTWNTKCGIATYSEHLAAGFKRRPHILAARSDSLVATDDLYCSRCWDVGDEDKLQDLNAEIEAREFDALVIQWNFGFFHHDHLERFIAVQKAAGRVVLLDLHSTIDPAHAPQKKLINFIPALALADCVLTHSIDDMNRMKALGLVANVTLFPHGVLDLDRPPARKLPVPTIATYGFCLPHKGLEQVVQAVGILRELGDRVNLLMLNAEYPADVSVDLTKRLRLLISELLLDEQVTLETSFLSDEESLNFLCDVDLILFVYHPTSESVSGAARYGLASGRPTMVTELPIFAEFGNAVWRVSSNNPETLAESVKEALAEIRKNSNRQQEKFSAAQAWCTHHSYKVLSERLEGMLIGLHFDITSGKDRF